MISKNMQKFKTDDEKHLSFAEFTRIYLQRLYGYQIRRNVFASDYLAHQYYQLLLTFIWFWTNNVFFLKEIKTIQQLLYF